MRSRNRHQIDRWYSMHFHWRCLTFGFPPRSVSIHCVQSYPNGLSILRESYLSTEKYEERRFTMKSVCCDFENSPFGLWILTFLFRLTWIFIFHISVKHSIYFYSDFSETRPKFKSQCFEKKKGDPPIPLSLMVNVDACLLVSKWISSGRSMLSYLLWSSPAVWIE